MGSYYNDELRRRQANGDVGHAVLANFDAAAKKKNRWRALLVPLVMLALGILLVYVGPVPGLGMLLTFGAVMALPVVVIRGFLSP